MATASLLLALSLALGVNAVLPIVVFIAVMLMAAVGSCVMQAQRIHQRITVEVDVVPAAVAVGSDSWLSVRLINRSTKAVPPLAIERPDRRWVARRMDVGAALRSPITSGTRWEAALAKFVAAVVAPSRLVMLSSPGDIFVAAVPTARRSVVDLSASRTWVRDPFQLVAAPGRANAPGSDGHRRRTA